MYTPTPEHRKEKPVCRVDPETWIWKSSSDALKSPSTLPHYMWELLGGYTHKDDFNKYYKSEEQALQQLDLMLSHIQYDMKAFAENIETEVFA